MKNRSWQGFSLRVISLTFVKSRICYAHSSSCLQLAYDNSKSQVGVSVKVKYSHSDVTKKLHTSMSEERSSMYQLGTTLELAQFSIRQDNIMLTHGFQRAVQRLPLDYNPHAYQSFLDHFGTHYIQQGTIGGRVQYNYVMNKTETSEAFNSSNTVSMCLSVELSVKVVSSASVGVDVCRNKSSTASTSDHTASFATHTIVDNIGGVSGAALTFAAGNVSRAQQDQFWAGVRQNPGFLSKQVSSICGLISFTRVANWQKIQENCEQAVLDYLTSYAPSACDHCMNGGLAIKMDGVCSCTCPNGCKGFHCESCQGKTIASFL